MDGITKFDSRLLLYKALEHAQKNQLFKGSFISDLEDQVADIAIEYATRYYKPIYEEYLIHSVYCVLGIANLALVDKTENNLELAAQFITEKGFHSLFRKGWTLVNKLAEIKNQYKFENLNKLEKDISEDLIAEPEQLWTGYQHYQQELEINKAAVEEFKFKMFLIEVYHQKNNPNDFNFIDNKNNPLSEYNFYVIETLLFSLMIFKEPKGPINVEQTEEIVKKLSDPDSVNQFKNRLFGLRNKLPKDFQNAYKSYTEKFWSTIVEPILKKYHSDQENIQATFDYLVLNYDIKTDPDKISKKMVESKKRGFLDQFSIDDLLESLLTADPVDVLSSIEYLLEKFFKDLTEKDLLAIIEETEAMHWRGKIAWEKLSKETLLKFFEELSFSESANIKIVLSEIFKKIKKNQIKNFSKWPFKHIDLIFKNVKESQFYLPDNFQLTAKDATKILDDTINFPESIYFFLPIDQWYDFWSKNDIDQCTKLLNFFVNSDEISNWSKEKINELLVDGVVDIIKNDRVNRSKKEERLNEEIEILKALKTIVQKNDLPKIKRQISKKLKQ